MAIISKFYPAALEFQMKLNRDGAGMTLEISLGQSFGRVSAGTAGKIAGESPMRLGVVATELITGLLSFGFICGELDCGRWPIMGVSCNWQWLDIFQMIR